MDEKEQIVLDLARDTYETDEIQIEGEVEKVDGGYWVTARVWISNDDLGTY